MLWKFLDHMTEIQACGYQGMVVEATGVEWHLKELITWNIVEQGKKTPTEVIHWQGQSIEETIIVVWEDASKF